MKSPIGQPQGTRVQAIGMSWYSEADYAAARAIMADGDRLPVTYAAWLARAEQQLRRLEGEGHKIIRARIDPATFPAWCASRGLTQIDAKARTLWAADYAARQIGL
jgi:hypothetical protein